MYKDLLFTILLLLLLYNTLVRKKSISFYFHYYFHYFFHFKPLFAFSGYNKILLLRL